jgi:hypothetical protein
METKHTCSVKKPSETGQQKEVIMKSTFWGFGTCISACIIFLKEVEHVRCTVSPGFYLKRPL